MTSRAASHGADEEREGFLANGVPDWTALPPPPTPSSHQRRESRLGCGVVVSIVGACIAGARAARAMLACAPDHLVRRWVLPLVYAEAAVARAPGRTRRLRDATSLLHIESRRHRVARAFLDGSSNFRRTFRRFACLAGLLWGDPGTIKRSTATCAPIPAAVLARLRAGEAAAEKNGQNVTGDDGRVYCVRCLVWRPPRGAHHCSTCQRCVADFDHHCGVFGRCIAGTWRSGNMPYFNVIILMAVAGFITCIACFFMGAVGSAPPHVRHPRMGRVG